MSRLCFLLFTTCAAPIEIQDSVEVIPFSEVNLTSAEILHGDDCSRVVSPTPEALKYVEHAVQRWSYSTGCDIHIGEGGVPFDLVPKIWSPEHFKYVAGVTHVNSLCQVEYMQLSGDSSHPYATVTHEIGHWLSGACYGTENGGHTQTGIMAAPIKDDTITEENLELVCGHLPCKNFIPAVAWLPEEFR